MMWIIGVDESGTGALAGPIMAAAVAIWYEGTSAEEGVEFFSEFRPIKGVTDSKKIGSEATRWNLAHEVAGWLIDRQQGHMSLSAELVKGRTDHARAHRKAMSSAALDAASLCGGLRNCWFIVDGTAYLDGIPTHKQFPCPRADGTYFPVSAASILAKSYRDLEMRELEEDYPLWEFSRHKGYGTAQHLEEIEKHGLSPIHRPKAASSAQRKSRLT